MAITLAARGTAVIGSLMIITGPFFPGSKVNINGVLRFQSYWDDATADSAILVVLGLCCLLTASLGLRKACRSFAAIPPILLALGYLGAFFFYEGLPPGSDYQKEYAWGMYVILAGILLLAVAVRLLRKPRVAS